MRPSGTRAALAALACALLLASRAGAAALAGVYELAGGEGGVPQPVFLELVVNGVRHDAVLAELTPDDVWAAAEDLSRAGLAAFRGARRTSGGRELVSLRSLAPELSFALDDTALALDLRASAALLQRVDVDLAWNRLPPGARRADATSAFLNYSAQLTDTGDPSGAAEMGVSLGKGDLLLAGATVDPRGRVVRGLTTLTLDRPERLLRFDAGDAVAPAVGLGGGAVVLGAGVARDFSLNPYFVRSPLPSLTGFAATPSTAEVWVNGQLVRRQPLAPGTYDFTNLPVHTGANDVRVVVRDAFGRETAIDAAPYVGADLLLAGMHDFSVHAGIRRERLGLESFDYGEALLVARERFGLSDRLTLGGRLEASPRLASGGASFAILAPLGQVDAEVAASAGEGASGAAAFGAWRLQTRRWSTSAYARWESTRYAHASLEASDDRALLRAGLTASATMERVTVSGEVGTLVWRDAPRENRVDLRVTWPFAPGHSLAISSQTSFGPGRSPEYGLFISIVFGAGRRSTAVMSAGARSDGTGSAAIGLNRSLPSNAGPGYGYAVTAASAARSGSVDGRVEAQSDFARAEATFATHGNDSGGAFAVSGGVVLLREGAFLTRPVEQGFALVRVPGVAGVTAYRENEPVGRTNRDGDLLVPSLLPFRANRLSIDDRAVPLDRSIGAREQFIIAPRRSAAIASFAVERLRAVTGRLRVSVPGGLVAPSGGIFRVGGGDRVFSSPIGDEGLFWLDAVPEGTYAAEIFWRGRLCRFSITVPEGAAPVQDLGRLSCGTGPTSQWKDVDPSSDDVVSEGAPASGGRGADVASAALP